jgi:hypothetical protein
MKTVGKKVHKIQLWGFDSRKHLIPLLPPQARIERWCQFESRLILCPCDTFNMNQNMSVFYANLKVLENAPP